MRSRPPNRSLLILVSTRSHESVEMQSAGRKPRQRVLVAVVTEPAKLQSYYGTLRRTRWLTMWLLKQPMDRAVNGVQYDRQVCCLWKVGRAVLSGGEDLRGAAVDERLTCGLPSCAALCQTQQEGRPPHCFRHCFVVPITLALLDINTQILTIDHRYLEYQQSCFALHNLLPVVHTWSQYPHIRAPAYQKSHSLED